MGSKTQHLTDEQWKVLADVFYGVHAVQSMELHVMIMGWPECGRPGHGYMIKAKRKSMIRAFEQSGHNESVVVVFLDERYLNFQDVHRRS